MVSYVCGITKITMHRTIAFDSSSVYFRMRYKPGGRKVDV